MAANCPRASWRFSVISRAIMSGGGRFLVSSRLSSLSKVMSRFALSLCISFSYVYGLKHSVSLRSWRFCGL